MCTAVEAGGGAARRAHRAVRVQAACSERAIGASGGRALAARGTRRRRPAASLLAEPLRVGPRSFPTVIRFARAPRLTARNDANIIMSLGLATLLLEHRGVFCDRL